jgi:hypothetical protein
MGGGLMQLVAYGAQDIYLTGNPQITFFKVVYRRHTNFSMESIKQNSNGTKVNFSTIISRNGDLVNNVYLEVTGNDFIRWGFTDFCSINSIVDTVELEIGGQLIDRQNGAIMDILGNLHKENPTGSPLTLYENKLLRARYGNAVVVSSSLAGNGVNTFNQKCWVPLHFWFCRYAGCALPLIALQYHEVKLNFKLYEDSNNQGHIRLPTTESVLIDDDAKMNDIEVDVWADYVYLDTDERRRFAQVSHEYLIEQVQRQIHYPNVTLHADPNISGKYKTMSNGRVDLTFNHPVKELIWSWVSTRASTFSPTKRDPECKQLDRGYYTLLGSDINMDRPDFHDRYDKFGPDANLFGSIIKDETMYQLKLNGHDRFAKMDANYFTRLQTWKHHSGGSLNRAVTWTGDNKDETSSSLVPSTTRDEAIDLGALNSDYINVYSFALKPEEHQPSGTCNFSRIDTANLHYELRSKPYKTEGECCNVQDISLEVYAINYNVLRIMSGMGGLAYSN